MTSEQRDPREAVLDEYTVFPGAAPKLLARLDAADPLRAMLPEVVEALELAHDEAQDLFATLSDERVQQYGPTHALAVGRIARTLTKLRALTHTEGGTDDG